MNVAELCWWDKGSRSQLAPSEGQSEFPLWRQHSQGRLPFSVL